MTSTATPEATPAASWSSRIAQSVGDFLLPHEHVRRLGEAWVDLFCVATDVVIAHGAKWLPLMAHAYWITEHARQASFALFHAPYATMADSLQYKAKECDTERNDSVLLKFQLQELRARLATREATIFELQRIAEGQEPLRERNGELSQELNRLSSEHRATLAARDDEIMRLGIRLDTAKEHLRRASEEKRRVVDDKESEITRLQESLKALKVGEIAGCRCHLMRGSRSNWRTHALERAKSQGSDARRRVTTEPEAA